MKKKHLDTEVIHEGYDAKSLLGSVSPPIFQTSTFEMDSYEHGINMFNGEAEGHIYSRLSNPTVELLETRMATLEGAEAGLAFASGMGAISSVLFSLLGANDHVICSTGLYGSTYSLFGLLAEKMNITVEFTDFASKDSLEKLIRKETACIYIETPVNPTMEIYDLAMISSVANGHGIPTVVDNTFATPYIQRPIELGCTLVVHSATKYLNGHGDVVAGIAAGNKDLIDKIRRTSQRDLGATLAPSAAWLLLRGLKTFPLRMERHCQNAERAYEFLRQHPLVENVYFPGKSEETKPIFRKQMSQSGGIISFTLRGNDQDVATFFNHLQMIKLAVSLGDAESLMQHPATMTHKQIPREEGQAMGITDSLIRFSVGLEAWEDIEADLNEAFASLTP